MWRKNHIYTYFYLPSIHISLQSEFSSLPPSSLLDYSCLGIEVASPGPAWCKATLCALQLVFVSPVFSLHIFLAHFFAGKWLLNLPGSQHPSSSGHWALFDPDSRLRLTSEPKKKWISKHHHLISEEPNYAHLSSEFLTTPVLCLWILFFRRSRAPKKSVGAYFGKIKLI